MEKLLGLGTYEYVFFMQQVVDNVHPWYVNHEMSPLEVLLYSYCSPFIVIRRRYLAVESRNTRQATYNRVEDYTKCAVASSF
jgi:hypothetical protein